MAKTQKQEKCNMRDNTIRLLSLVVFGVASIGGMIVTAMIVEYLMEGWTLIEISKCLIAIVMCATFVILTIIWEKEHYCDWIERVEMQCELALLVTLVAAAVSCIILSRLMFECPLFENAETMWLYQVSFWAMIVDLVCGFLFWIAFKWEL